MKPEAILALLFVRATEESDPAGEVVTWAERERASRAALVTAGDPGPAELRDHINQSQWLFLAERAMYLQGQRQETFNDHSGLLATQRIGLAVCIAALLLGWMSHDLGLSRSFNLLAGPFLFVLIWNTVVYALLVARVFRGKRHHRERGMAESLVTRWIIRFTNKEEHGKARPMYAASVLAWYRSWVAPTVVSWFHAGSACFTAGLLAAIYFRGLSIGYVAGWESTWLGPEGVRSILGFLLGPASHLTGIALPVSLEAWAALRWGTAYQAASAGPWIHLYSVTLTLWIIAPRALLATVAHIKARKVRILPPRWSSKEPYVHRILSLAREGGDAAIAILPFDFKAGGLLHEGLFRDAVERLIRETWGRDARSCWWECAAYGSEDLVWQAGWSGTTDCDGAVLIFDARATPEEEVHGVLLDGVLNRMSAGRCGLVVAVECSEFSADRIEARLDLWHKLASKRMCRMLPVNRGVATDASAPPSSFIFRRF
jgi:hypothetical protein